MIVAPGNCSVARGYERADRRRAHGIAVLIHDEQAIGISVEGEPYIRLLFRGELLQINKVLRVKRVRLVVGESAVELKVERLQRDR